MKPARDVLDASKLVQILAFTQTKAGRKRALAVIRRHPFVATYGTDPAFPGLLIERAPDGRTRVGTFRAGQFLPQASRRGRSTP